MKKMALIIDFDFDYGLISQYNNLDLYQIDRLDGIIKNIIKNGVELDLVDLTISDLYQAMRRNYEHILALIQVYSPIEINEHRIKQIVNRTKTEKDAKVWVYLINYTNQAKAEMVEAIAHLVESNCDIKTIMTRIDQIKKQEIFPRDSMLMYYYNLEKSAL